MYDEDVTWRRKRVRQHERFSHGGRRFGASGDGSNRVPSVLSRSSAGSLELIGELGYRGLSEDGLHARVLPCQSSGVDRRFCKWEELRLNPFADDEEDHPACRRDGCDISAADLAAFRLGFILDPLCRIY